MGGTNNQAKRNNFEVLTEEVPKVAEPVLLLLITSVERIGPVFKRRPMFVNPLQALQTYTETTKKNHEGRPIAHTHVACQRNHTGTHRSTSERVRSIGRNVWPFCFSMTDILGKLSDALLAYLFYLG
nr:hypothetical protein [Tanacetum cinerariifolium]